MGFERFTKVETDLTTKPAAPAPTPLLAADFQRRLEACTSSQQVADLMHDYQEQAVEIDAAKMIEAPPPPPEPVWDGWLRETYRLRDGKTETFEALSQYGLDVLSRRARNDGAVRIR